MGVTFVMAARIYGQSPRQGPHLARPGGAGKGSGFLIEFGFFDAHVFEFTGFEHLTAFETFDEFGVFLAGDDLHTGVLTLCHGGFSREVAAVGLTS